IILMIPPAQASPCSESCDYNFTVCMEQVSICSTNAYYNNYNCLIMFPGDQSGVCNYFYWLDMQTCEYITHDCNFAYDFCLTSCQ
ncbi:MAG TPA: hypothetical protein VEU30_16955, partial [Thermoanaerobaculia bacterium]|nr:hypothetical protein [Thermoanaerobaculia bacterium]